MELLGPSRIGIDLGGPIDARIGAIAAAQRGRVARRQLLGAGVNTLAIVRRLHSGRLDEVHRGVYEIPHTEGLPLGDETAALLACGDSALLSHHSAVTLWGLRPGTARPVHVTVPMGHGCRALAGVQVHRSRTLVPADVRVREGLPVTAPARTVLDVATNLTDRDIERMLDEALFAQRILTLASVRDVLSRAGSHPGRARLARVAANHTRSTQTDSPPEETALRMIRAAGLPEPRLRAYVLDYRLDLFWPELRLAVEIDAYGTHGSPARFESDRLRDARLLSERGIRVLRLTRVMIERRPFEVIAITARAIGRCEAERAR